MDEKSPKEKVGRVALDDFKLLLPFESYTPSLALEGMQARTHNKIWPQMEI